MRLTALALITLASLISSLQAAPSTAAGSEDHSGRITLRWQIDSAQDNYGFFLNRSESPDGPWVRVQPPGVVIPGVGTTTDVHQFEYLDEGLVRGRDYYYQLMEVSLTGEEVNKTAESGPLRAHCRTVEEDIVHARNQALGQAIASEEVQLTSPLAFSVRAVPGADAGPAFEITGSTPASAPEAASMEWIAFFHSRNRQGVQMLANWSSWEASPLAMTLLPETQLMMFESPLSGVPSSGEYLFLVGEGASAEAERDEHNGAAAMDEERGRAVSVFAVGSEPATEPITSEPASIEASPVSAETAS